MDTRSPSNLAADLAEHGPAATRTAENEKAPD